MFLCRTGADRDEVMNAAWLSGIPREFNGRFVKRNGGVV